MQDDPEFKMIVHDIRKPLASIELFLRVFKLSSPEGRTQLLENTDDLLKQISRANILLANLIGNEHNTLKIETCSIDSLLLSVFKDMSQQFLGKEIDFRYSFLSTFQLLVNKHEVERIFSNLINNAIEAMPATGTIWFNSADRTLGSKHFVEIKVGNTGSFIDPKYLDSIFNLFVTHEKEKGIGLGLAICKKIVNSYGGEIYCESDRDRGTEFTFLLPASPQIAKFDITLPSCSKDIELSGILKRFSTVDFDIQLKIEELLKTQALTIAIVEDDPNYLDCFNRQLLDYGHSQITVIQSSTFLAGFHTILKANPPLAFIDLDLSDPIFTGIDLIRALRNHDYQGLICLHSNHASSKLFLQSFEAGANLCVPKPLSAQDFLNVLTFFYSNSNRVEPKTTFSSLSFIEQGIWNFRLEESLDLILYPIFSKDLEGRYQICNQSFSTQILGLPKAQIYNLRLQDFAVQIPAELAETYRKKDQDLIESKGVQTYSSEVLCSDGIRRTFTFFKKALLDDNNSCVGIAGIMYPEY